MTQEALIQIIFLLCSSNISSNSYRTEGYNQLAREDRIECMVNYTNCGIVKDGQVLSLSEFKKKCLKK